eukprot:m.632115 g.632115  ORF g.632115 m.632115 type:complete len:190 (+) comp58290_c0_seq7:639-1208(+)
MTLWSSKDYSVLANLLRLGCWLRRSVLSLVLDTSPSALAGESSRLKFMWILHGGLAGSFIFSIDRSHFVAYFYSRSHTDQSEPSVIANNEQSSHNADQKTGEIKSSRLDEERLGQNHHQQDSDDRIAVKYQTNKSHEGIQRVNKLIVFQDFCPGSSQKLLVNFKRVKGWFWRDRLPQELLQTSKGDRRV